MTARVSFYELNELGVRVLLFYFWPCVHTATPTICFMFVSVNKCHAAPVITRCIHLSCSRVLGMDPNG